MFGRRRRQDMGNTEEAMADFDAVLRMQPGNSHALFRRGFLWKRKKKYDEAAQDFEDAKQAVRAFVAGLTLGETPPRSSGF